MYGKRVFLKERKKNDDEVDSAEDEETEEADEIDGEAEGEERF